MRIVALVPAYNESSCISETIEALLSQTVSIDIVILPNGCTDDTADIARRYPVTVMEFGQLKHKKSEAMNLGWETYCSEADLVITVDADTVLVPTAVEEWIEEFVTNPLLAGSCARFTMIGKSFITRLQRMDFSMGIDISLRRGWTCVLAGAASCFRNSVLKQVEDLDDRAGPWSYDSAVEDFEVTYQARRLGFSCWVSPSVRAYTDAMSTWKALRSQRRKWLTGTIEDLIKFGLNKTTFVMWAQQFVGWASFLILLLFMSLLTYTLISGSWQYSPLGLVFSVIIPLLVVAKNIKHSTRIPHRDNWDVAMAASIVIYEVFSWVRTYWFLAAWGTVLLSKITKKRKDLWSMQYKAENAG